jgi:predicted dehydrogenase
MRLGEWACFARMGCKVKSSVSRVRSLLFLTVVFAIAGTADAGEDAQVRLITLDPGHFHASLVQKVMYPGVSPVVHVYSASGPDLDAHLKRIEDFNTRPSEPTHWHEQVYSGRDFLEIMLREKAGNVVVIAGNNTRKTHYIARSVAAGLNVLADKPMAITPADFELLRKAFVEAAKNKVLLYDIMTERFEITSVLQRELARDQQFFGRVEKGTEKHPAVVMDSVHHFFKEVAGKPLIRPGWFMDVRQEGEAIPDVGTHLIDHVQEECFPDQALDWRKDIKVNSARRWATRVSREQFKRATGLNEYPDFLKADARADGGLDLFANGEVHYTLRGIHVAVIARWNFEAPPGGKDALYSLLRGTKADLTIKQGVEEKYQPTLYVANRSGTPASQFEKRLRKAIEKLSVRYPGLDLKSSGENWTVVVPEKYEVGHESHFGQVTEHFLEYLRAGTLPAWEVPNMLAKYYTSTEAYRLSHKP